MSTLGPESRDREVPTIEIKDVTQGSEGVKWRCGEI